MHPPGLPVNRVRGPYMAKAFRMLDESVSAEAIDKAAEQSGMPTGPVTLTDTVGRNICAAAGLSFGTGFAPFRGGPMKSLKERGAAA